MADKATLVNEQIALLKSRGMLIEIYRQMFVF